MTILNHPGRRLFVGVIAVAVLLFVIVFLVVEASLSTAAQKDAHDQTAVGAASAANAIGGMFSFGHDLAQTVTGFQDYDDVVQRTASPATRLNVQKATCNIIGSNPAITAYYLFDRAGRYVVGEDKAHCDRGQTVPLAAVPAIWLTPGSAMTTNLRMTMSMPMPNWLAAFGPGTGPYGSLYHLHPVSYAAYGGRAMGTLIERVNAASLLSGYIHAGNDGNLILDGNIVIGPQIADYYQRGELPVTTVDRSLDTSITGGLRQTPVGYMLDGDTPHFSLAGADEVGSSAPITMSSLRVLNYTSASSLLGATRGTVLIVMLIAILAITGLLVLLQYLNRQLRRGEQQATERLQAKSEALTEDIVAVSQALAVAREGDLTVQVPDSESEVGLLSLSLNGLIGDYSQIVGGIIRASQAVQEGAARVDEGVRRIVDVATSQAESVALVATSVESVATSAVDVQEGTEMATTLAANARVAVNSGQESVGRIAEAVDAIKEAAIGTTREFKRLQEDSIRLTALVASVKSNAENLDMQAANATLEARHLGTESGSAFATNIGRLARQAQDTLADAEGAVRSVVTSIDEVNKRIERIAEQVRHGVDEVRRVRITFDEVTVTNNSLVQFIDGVADSAEAQARSAQEAARSISDISRAFEQFTDLLVSSSDGIAGMRLIVAGLRESVADLRVEHKETLLIGAGSHAA